MEDFDTLFEEVMKRTTQTEKFVKARRILCETILTLGTLSTGQKVDLLLDNMPELRDSGEARALVDEIAEAGGIKVEKCPLCDTRLTPLPITVHSNNYWCSSCSMKVSEKELWDFEQDAIRKKGGVK